ncbi:MAG: hypothetical protein JSS29_14865 [Proteobacteria bacterium]|nr:hypothetical protein [Pseudomonadota bacterium]
MKILGRTFLWAALVWAGSVWSADCEGLRCYGSISMLDVESGGTVYVGLAGGIAGLTGCTPNSGAESFFTLLPSNPNNAQIYSLLLTAASTGIPVAIVADNASTGCTIHYVNLIRTVN